MVDYELSGENYYASKFLHIVLKLVSVLVVEFILNQYLLDVN